MLALISAVALLASADEYEDSPPSETSRWGTAASSGFKLGVGRGVNLAFGPRFGILPPPARDSTYLTPAIAVMIEGDIGIERNTSMFGALVRIELLCAPGGGLLAPWANLWVSGGGGVAFLGSTQPLPMAHVGIGLGGNAFADGGKWGADFTWADWMNTLAWPIVLFGTIVGLPIALINVEVRWNFYPTVSSGTGWPSVLVGMGM